MERDLSFLIRSKNFSILSVYPEWNANVRIQVKVADDAVIDPQRLNQLQLPSFIFLFLQLLGSAIQEKSLIEKFPVFLQQFNIAHDMQRFAALVLHSVFDADAVTFLLQFLHAFLKLFPVFLHNASRNHVKSVFYQFVHRLVSHDLKRRLIYTQNACPIYAMAYNPAVNRGKYLFQRLILLRQFLFISPFFCYIDRYPYGPHYAAVQIIKGGFICCKRTSPSTCLNRFFRYESFFAFHNLSLGFDTGRIIPFHIPNISVSPPFYLMFGLVYRLTETIVYLLMNTIFIFIPDQVRDVIDRDFKKMVGLPEVFAHFICLLPS